MYYYYFAVRVWGASKLDEGLRLATLLRVSALTAKALNKLTRSWLRLAMSSSQSLRTCGADPKNADLAVCVMACNVL